MYLFYYPPFAVNTKRHFWHVIGKALKSAHDQLINKLDSFLPSIECVL